MEQYRDKLLAGALGLDDSGGRSSFASMFNPMAMASQTMQQAAKPINYFG